MGCLVGPWVILPCKNEFDRIHGFKIRAASVILLTEEIACLDLEMVSEVIKAGACVEDFQAN